MKRFRSFLKVRDLLGTCPNLCKMFIKKLDIIINELSIRNLLVNTSKVFFSPINRFFFLKMLYNRKVCYSIYRHNGCLIYKLLPISHFSLLSLSILKDTISFWMSQKSISRIMICLNKMYSINSIAK